MSLWWLSFVNPQRPEGQRFLGVALIEVEDVPNQTEAERLAAAIRGAWRHGCNPGGEIQGWELPLDQLSNAKRLTLARVPHHKLLDQSALALHDLLP